MKRWEIFTKIVSNDHNGYDIVKVCTNRLTDKVNFKGTTKSKEL